MTRTTEDLFNGKKYAGHERLPTDNTIYTVYLDSGNFKWLLEILRAKQNSLQWLPPYQALVKRTLLAFEEAERAVRSEQAVEIPLPEIPPVKRKRTIPRPKVAAKARKPLH